MQCISCGKKLTESDLVCPKCGKKQPLAETDQLTKRPLLKSLSPIFLLIGLVLVPLGLTGVINIIFVTAIPFLLALIFKHIK